MPPSADNLAVIPARYASSRFPGKPLAAETGKPLIQHVVERARQARLISRVIVATDDQRIFDAVRAFGGEAMMTCADHPNGTSRIAEVVSQLSDVPAVVVNVQGDEPEIEPAIIDRLVDGLASEPANGAAMATVASFFAADEDPADPNIVKVVVSAAGQALYFSRSLIPFDRDCRRLVRPLKHVGLYAYHADFLLKYVTLPPSPLERCEQLEQLRALEHGYRIKVVLADARHHGIDTPEQYAAFVRRYRSNH